ncbi:MAG: transcriptional regulator [Candidatus Nanosalina sp.]
MRFELEVISEEILPAVRSLIAQEMKDSYGLKQREIADKTGMTQPAVSNYLNESRADKEIKKKIGNDPQIQILIEDAAGKAVKDEEYAEEISQIIWNIRDKGLVKERFKDTEKII